MVVTPGTAALTVHLPCKTCQRHPVSHKISSRQAAITVRDPVGVAGHEADIAGGGTAVEVVGARSGSPVPVMVGRVESKRRHTEENGRRMVREAEVVPE